MYAEEGDIIRVIGTFCYANNYSLIIDDYCEDINSIDKASMIIVEPFILIPTTSIIKTFPCIRRAYISNQYKGKFLIH